MFRPQKFHGFGEPLCNYVVGVFVRVFPESESPLRFHEATGLRQKYAHETTSLKGGSRGRQRKKVYDKLLPPTAFGQELLSPAHLLLGYRKLFEVLAQLLFPAC
jgi:hypothetical protein